MSNITKADLVRQIAGQTGLTQKGVESVLNALGNQIAASAADGATVITGFGRFVPKTRAARIGRNPATGEPLEIPARTTVSFRLAKAKS